LATAIDNALTAAAPYEASKKSVYSTYNTTTPTYVRNASCWAAGFDLRSASSYNTQSGLGPGAVLIAPDIVLMTNHARLSTGTRLDFVASNGAVHQAILGPTLSVPHAGIFRDITVGRLQAPVNAAIQPVKIVQTDILDAVPDLRGVPVLALDREEHAIVFEANYVSNTSGQSTVTYGRVLNLRTPVGATPDRAQWSEPLVGGDSSGQIYALHETGEIGLIGLFTFRFTSGTNLGAGGGPFLPHWHEEINALMTQLGSASQITPTSWTF